ncbi:MAG: hypothetical protein HYY93_15180 [Planctomycetes bacterium]|nr:hypothetical protein [Planctomycetota bacterium]
MPDIPPPASSRLLILRASIVATVVITLTAILIQVKAKSEHGDRRCCCIGNLKQLGVSLALYVDRFGAGRKFPDVPGRAFWNVLRTVPTPATSMLPDNDGLFLCLVKNSTPSPTRIDFTGPRRGATFPVTDALGPNRAIAADLPTNHSGTGVEDVNVLLFDGHVEPGEFGSQMWQKAAADTQR